MRYADRPLFYYSPDEPAGGDFDDPGDFDPLPAEALSGGGEDDPEAPASILEDAPEDVLPAKESEAIPGSVEPVEGDDKPKPDSEAQVAEVKPSVVAESPAPNQAHLDALQAACDALGIPETDPVKQAEAIVAAKADIQARREQEAQQKEQNRIAQAEASWTKSAEEATNAQIWARLREAGWDVDTPDLWNPATWAGTDTPNYHELLAHAFRTEQASPVVEAFYKDTFNQTRQNYENTQAKIAETLAKYPQHDPTVAALMRENNVDPAVIDTVARSTHEWAQRQSATANSALTAAQQRLASLEAQVSGHEAALAAAREEARAEGLKAALAEVAAGLALPNTVGLGGTSPEPLGVKGVFDDPGDFSLADLKEYANHR
jgi:hypothetical protein